MQLTEYQAMILRDFLAQGWRGLITFLVREHGLDEDEAEDIADDIYEILEQV